MNRNDILDKDENLFTYRWLLLAFVVAPPIIIAVKEPHTFVHSYIQFMLFALSWPLMLLIALYFFRHRFLVRLIERGREMEGTVRSIKGSSGKLLGYASRYSVDRQRIEVAVRIDGDEKLIDVDVPLRSAPENSRVTVLVDPLKLRGILMKTH